MSFSSLSREIRDLIYHALLCPPDGVHLHSDYKRRMGNGAVAKTTSRSINGYYYTRKGAYEHVPPAIFCVNHQISQEVSEVFYRFNRFTFDSHARAALKFLKCLRPSSRQRIRDIAFACKSTSAKESDNTHFWEAVSEFIARHMSLRSVTIEVPHGYNYELDSTKEARPAPDENWYWWPAVRLMAELLLAGKIGELRIA